MRRSSLPYAGERFVFLIKADDLHLADLVGVLDGVKDRRAVVAPEADQAGDVRVFDESVGSVEFRTGAVGVVRCGVDDLDL